MKFKEIKNKVVGLAIAGALIGGVVGQPFVTFAGNTGDTYDSKGVVTFIPNDDITKPVDPSNPGEEVTPVDPIDPTNPVNPGTAGPLSIDFASTFDFGKNKITTADQTYYARAQKILKSDGVGGTIESYVPNYVQVTDNRGTNKGWTLKVKQNGQLSNATAQNTELTGAEITLGGGVANNKVTTAIKPKVEPTVTLNPDGSEVLVMSAADGIGAGTWVDYFGTVKEITEGANKTQITEAVTLTVPGTTFKDAVTYSTSLTWVLTDVPGNN